MGWQLLLLGLALFVLQLILAPKPQNAKAASLEDFTAPTAEEGRSIPVLFGTKDLKAPNVVWYGDLKKSAILGERRYGIVGPKQIIGYKYYLGMHLGLIHGPADYVLGITAGDKSVFTGKQASGSLYINKPSLFGGEDTGGEGGIQGTVDIEMGEPTQGQNSYLAARLDADVPAYRGIVAAVLRRVYIGTSPYLKPWHFLLQRILLKSDGTAQWYSDKARIPCGRTVALIFSVDLGPEMANEGRLAIVQSAMNLTLNRLKTKIATEGLNLNLSIDVFGSGGTQNGGAFEWPGASEADIDEAKAKVNAWVADELESDFEEVGAVWGDIFFIRSYNLTEDVQQRIGVMLTAGEPSNTVGAFPTSDQQLNVDLARARMADPLNQSTGFFSGDNKCELYAINVNATNIKYTAQMKNEGGVPNMTSGWYPQAMFNILDTIETGSPFYYDMNPAHIIRECLTDRIWGMGYNESDIDDASFTAAADALHAESFGLTLLWQREEEINEFVTTVISHIDAYLYTSLDTGKFVLKLIRDDYDVDTIPVLTEDDIIEWTELDRRQPAEVINNVVVQFYNRPQVKDGSVQVTDIAQTAQSGGVRSVTRQYPGIACPPLAARVAARDLKTLGAGVITGTITAKRVAETLNPGDPFRLYSTRHNLNGEVMRVAEIRLGDGRDNGIPIKIIQDVFTLGDDSLVGGSVSRWVNPNNYPAPVNLRVVHEMPWYEIVSFFGATDAALVLTNDPDAGFLEAFGAAPTPDASHAIVSIDKGLGDGFVDAAGAMEFNPTALLSAVLTEATTDINIIVTDGVDLDLVEVGSIAAIVGDTPEEAEFIRVDSINAGAGTLTIGRGCLDTIIRAHAAGAGLLFFEGRSFSDMIGYTVPGISAVPDNLDVKLRPITGLGELDLASAPTDTVTFASRAYRSYRPADCQVDGISFGPADLVGVNPIPATWVRRNRITELDEPAPLDWDDADATPEAGQTTTITLTDSLGNFLFDYTGIAGTSQNVDPSDFAGEEEGFIKFKSVRGGYDSWQEYSIEVFIEPNFLILEDSSTDVLLLEDDGTELRLG